MGGGELETIKIPAELLLGTTKVAMVDSSMVAYPMDGGAKRAASVDDLDDGGAEADDDNVLWLVLRSLAGV